MIRGIGSLDEAALIKALGALGRLAIELHAIIDSVDINPLVVLPHGQGAVALDGLIVLQGSDR
jgi:hypothetical protein